MNRLRSTRPLLAAATAYVALTIAYSWPVPRHLVDGIPHDPWDPVLNTWILWWTTRAVLLTAHWWNAPIFYPATGALAFSEHLLGLAPLTAPVIALTHNALLGYNVALLSTYVLSGLGGYFLGHTLTRRDDAAFVCGIAFAFAPYRLAQLPHVQVLSSFWTPVCLAALHRYDRDGSAKWAALAAVAWMMQGLACGYYLLFLSVLLVLWFAWFAIGRWPARKFTTAVAWWILPLLVIAPILLGYQHVLVDTYDFRRGLAEIRAFSADVGSLLTATNELRLWGWLHVIDRPESELFPGATIVALSVFAVFAARPLTTSGEVPGVRSWLRRGLAALFLLLLIAAALPIYYGSWRATLGGVRVVSIARADMPVTLALFTSLAWLSLLPRVAAAARARRPLLFYGVAAVATWVFALGPDPLFFSHPALHQAPYGWLMRLPAFDSLRVPARFWMMTIVCLSAIAALAIERLRGRTRPAIVAAATAGLLLDGWPRTIAVYPAPDYRPAPAGVSARLDLPSTDDSDAAALYQQTLEDVPLYNGYSGYAAPHVYAMRALLDGHDPAVLKAMTARGSLGVVIDRTADGDGALQKFVAAYPGATLEQSHPAWVSYRLPAGPPDDSVPDVHGESLAIESLDAFPSAPHASRTQDANMRTRWSGGVQHTAADFTVELHAPGHVAQFVPYLGEFWTDFPQRLLIEVSSDGKAWQTVFDGPTALQTYYGALRHPKEVPLVFPIDRDNVRFIRMKQLGWGAHDWSIAELRVLQ